VCLESVRAKQEIWAHFSSWAPNFEEQLFILLLLIILSIPNSIKLIAPTRQLNTVAN